MTLPELLAAEGLVPVTGLRAGGWDWSEIEVYYKPDAGRFYWLTDSGCSCNWFGDADSYVLGDLRDGDRAAALQALGSFSHYDGDPSAEEVAQAKTALRDFRKAVS